MDDTQPTVEEVLPEPTQAEDVAVDTHEHQYREGFRICIICNQDKPEDLETPQPEPIQPQEPEQPQIASENEVTESPEPQVTEPQASIAPDTETPPVSQESSGTLPPDAVSPAEPIEPNPIEMLAPVTEKDKVILKDEEKREWRWWNDTAKLDKMREAFLMGCDILEACLYAEITPDQYHYYQHNIDTDYGTKVKVWREKPTLIARSTVVKAMKTDADLSLKYLERKKRDEFGLRTEVAGANGAPLNAVIEIVREKRTSVLDKNE
jgi:hypothetical protein